MKWVDDILNKAIKETKNVESVTFKGKATTDPFEIAELGSGWQAGYDFTLSNYTLEDGYKIDWPDGWAKGFYGNGFAEGCISGRSFIIDRDYPGWVSISGEHKDGMSWTVITFKDGRVLTTPKIKLKKHKNY